jgi:hypothetical protein
MGILDKFFHPDLTLNEDVAKEETEKALEKGKNIVGGVVGGVFNIAGRLKKTLTGPRGIEDLSPEDRQILDSMRAQREAAANSLEQKDQSA